MPNRERQDSLSAFKAGTLRVLCACDILNEGWDCPDIEVLLMARPTLSKVIYLQQLGRGTRKSPGKECLVVFDFVDNGTRYNQALSLHRVLGLSRYRVGGLVLAQPALLTAEEEALARGERPTTVLEIGLWVKDYQEIDVFNWQEAIAGMISVPDLELTLAATEGRIKRAVERGEVRPDHTLILGERTYHYFKRDRTEEIRDALGLPKVDDQTIRELFLEFVAEMDMAASYKPVMLRALLECVDDCGKAKLVDVVRAFRTFYEQRSKDGLPVERATARMSQVRRLDDGEVQRVMLEMPFRRFEQKHYLRYDRDLAFVRFDPRLWRQLAAGDRARIRELCDAAITAYYDRLKHT
jgi:hypothetical protein